MKRYLFIIGLLAFVALAARPAAAQSEATIAGIVYLDENRNGSRDEGEDGLLDIEVNFATSGWDTTINTDGAGAFNIDLNPATWTVSVLVPEGQYEATTDTEVDVLLESSGEVVNDLEFGLAVAEADEDDGGDASADDEVLPESGGPISETMLITLLVGVIFTGGAFVLIGNRRSMNTV